MKRDTDRLSRDVACLDAERLTTTLISTTGYHCEAWQVTRLIRSAGRAGAVDVVIKTSKEVCSLAEVRILFKEYLMLRERLSDMVPTACFVPTRVDGVNSVIVIVETVYPWFNIANPANEEETVFLLRQHPRARFELFRFVAAAKDWYYEHEGRVIDLYGLDNLVLDRNRRIRYVDSFRVFFHEDLLYLLDEPDPSLQEKIELSVQRRDYLEYVIRQSARPRPLLSGAPTARLPHDL